MRAKGDLPKPYYDEGGITIYNADCREILPLLDPVDLILTDPPYGIKNEGIETRDYVLSLMNAPLQ